MQGSSTKNYSTDDPNIITLKTNKLFYSLQMVDLDGSFTYSNVLSVNIPHVNVFAILPNPTGDYFTINGMDIQQVQVVDLSGRIVINKILKNRDEKVNVTKLTKGIYMVKAFDKLGTSQSVKLLVQ